MYNHQPGRFGVSAEDGGGMRNSIILTGVLLIVGPLAWGANGTGQVYIPNEIDEPVLQQTVLRHLDGSGFLRGSFADVINSVTARAFEASGDFVFDPAQVGDSRVHFAETMAYYHVTDYNAYVSTLGYSVVQFPIDVEVFAAQPQGPLFFPIPTQYDANVKKLFLAATIDIENSEALDGDVILHEYVHAIEHDLLGGAPGPFVTPDVTLSEQGTALMEALADYLTASRFGDPELGEASAQMVGAGVFVRSTENFRKWPDDFAVGALYRTGMIFSGALWDLRHALSAQTADSLVLEMIPLIPDNDGGTPELNTTFEDALSALIQADVNLNGGANAADIIEAFSVRGVGTTGFSTGFAMELHPGNNFDGTKIEQIPGADRLAVSFDRFVTKLDDLPYTTTMAPQAGADDKTTRDELEILDASDNVIGVFTGRQLQGATLVVLGDTVKFHLTTDGSIPPFGYRVLNVQSAVAGDNDGDGDIDLLDYTAMADCFFGPNVTPTPNPPATTAQCLAVFDFDLDSDVDLEDAQAFQFAFNP